MILLDCFGGSILTSIHSATAGTDPNLVELKVNYSGQKQMTSVGWNFRDDVITTSSSTTISHNYASTGTFTKGKHQYRQRKVYNVSSRLHQLKLAEKSFTGILKIFSNLDHLIFVKVLNIVILQY